MADSEKSSFMEYREGILVRQISEPGTLLIILLHGWGGDERAMWVFENVLPPSSMAVSIRGLFPIEDGGYQWTREPPSIELDMTKYENASTYLRTVRDDLAAPLKAQ